MKSIELFNNDINIVNDEYKLVAGMDEVGRGPLVGPVSVCLCIMPLNQESFIDGINDSKKISETKREKLNESIVNTAIDYIIIDIDEKTIDEINILAATKLAMNRAIKEIKTKPELVLIDAVKLDTDIQTQSIIHGDALSYEIAAASILAKVHRDKIMKDLAQKYPEYGFERNKGYGTKEHIEAL
ncbi:MAG: ribonuclease HII, partial [Clostridia bacterium]|nr:ribonuclease HII [Clostridia bacterium]